MDQFISGTISGTQIISLFFKAFSIAFALIYFLYSIIITKQTDELNKNLIVEKNSILYLLSFSQILFGFILLALAIFVV